MVIFEYTPQEQLGSPAPPGHLDSVPDGRERVQRGAHVQDGELVVLIHRPAVVVIDDVAHLLATAVNDPVVPVKGQLVPGEDREHSMEPFNGYYEPGRGRPIQDLVVCETPLVLLSSGNSTSSETSLN